MHAGGDTETENCSREVDRKLQSSFRHAPGAAEICLTTLVQRGFLFGPSVDVLVSLTAFDARACTRLRTTEVNGGANGGGQGAIRHDAIR